MAALECVIRDVAGDDGTLGECLKRHPDILPRPLDEAVKKVWGSPLDVGGTCGRGGEPEGEEVELVVGLSAVVVTYLARRIATAAK